MNKYQQLSEQWLLATKRKSPTRDLVQMFAQADWKEIATELNDDNHKKAFWINIYNAQVQYLLTEKPVLFADKSLFYSNPMLNIGGKKLSLNLIEHGLLRRASPIISLGYISNPLPSRFEKEYMISVKDFRIHFTLNCGAKSCPPIAFYQAQFLESQLDTAMAGYLEEMCRYEEETKTVFVPKILFWCRNSLVLAPTFSIIF
ncbi:MAG: DUF547 domain-containing protein [Verrucomicrobia bacterium]|nr:DUF547 domain-containing protein [Cytophagales bacterium]